MLNVIRFIRERITPPVRIEIELSRVRRGMEQVVDDALGSMPMGSASRMLRRSGRRARIILTANLTYSGLKRGLVHVMRESEEDPPLHAPRDLARRVYNAHRRATVVLKANLRLSEIEHGLAQMVDEAIDQIPLETPKGIARIVRGKVRKVLQTNVGMDGIARGIERTWNKTLEGLPLNEDLLVKQGAERSRHLNRQLAWSLAFIAGAVNAGGFLAVQTFTSHVTGVVSRAANEFVLGHSAVALAAVGVVVCFFAGAFCSGFLINLGRRHRFQAHYALSLMVEAVLLLLFGFLGGHLHEMKLFLPATVALLSFVMGMHNSVVTVISNAEVRTTHLTGIVTDMGLEFSRLLYFNVGRDQDEHTGRILGNRNKLILHGLILVSFFVGGLAGTVGFHLVGFKMTVFLAIALILLAWRPVLADIRIRFRVVNRRPDPIPWDWTTYVK